MVQRTCSKIDRVEKKIEFQNEEVPSGIAEVPSDETISCNKKSESRAFVTKSPIIVTPVRKEST